MFCRLEATAPNPPPCVRGNPGDSGPRDRDHFEIILGNQNIDDDLLPSDRDLMRMAYDVVCALPCDPTGKNSGLLAKQTGSRKNGRQS